MTKHAWIKMWVSSNGGQETVYRLVHRGSVEDAEEIKEIVTSWADTTSVGQCADHYRMDWVEVDALPDHVVKEMREDAQSTIRSAQNLLKALDLADVKPGCKRIGCDEIATKKVRLATDAWRINVTQAVEDAETDVCDACAKSNETRVVQNEKTLRQRADKKIASSGPA